MTARTVRDVALSGKTVLMRVDFNVPLKAGTITNDRRIVQALPTIQHVLGQGGKLVLMSHLGRPSGTGFEAEFSMAPVAGRLGELLKRPVRLGPPEVAGPDATALTAALAPGEVLVLENLRFHAGETIADKAKKNADGKLSADQAHLLDAFVADLAALGDVYVNDAFGTCHRKHASMYGAPLALRAKGGAAVAGFLVEKEIRYLHEAVSAPKRPFVAVLGGAKVSDKIKLIGNLLSRVDRILIGGAMAYTLLSARGVRVGKSLVESTQLEAMEEILARAAGKIMLPLDHVVAPEFSSDDARPTEGIAIPEGMMGLDIGPKTIAAYCAEIAKAGTVVWNGPMGVFERPAYATGTRAVAETAAAATDAGAVTVIGGGDSAAAVEQFGLAERMTHISTGGGASLEYLEGRPMPPIDILDQA